MGGRGAGGWGRGEVSALCSKTLSVASLLAGGLSDLCLALSQPAPALAAGG